MERQEVHMKIDSVLSEMLVRLDPRYAPFVDELVEEEGLLWLQYYYLLVAVTPATASLFNIREADAPGNRLATLQEFKEDRSILALCL
jgi:hypothetical protein